MLLLGDHKDTLVMHFLEHNSKAKIFKSKPVNIEELKEFLVLSRNSFQNHRQCEHHVATV